MIQGGEASGYTIVETMIFLAVTAMLFTSALTLISGRQATVQFAQATRDAQSKFQDIINQVSSGFYPTTGSFTCSANPLGTAPTFDVTTPSKQGTSNTCVFLGKVTQLGVGSDGDHYNVISVASRRVDSIGLEVNSLDKAKPTAISPPSAAAAASGSVPDVTEKTSFQYGLRVTRVTVPDPATGAYAGAASDYGSIAFFGSFPGAAASDPSSLTSGAQHVNFAPVSGSVLGEDLVDAVTHVNAINDSNTKMTPDASLKSGIVICLSDQGGGRKAWLTIGGTVSNTSVKLDIGKSAVCP